MTSILALGGDGSPLAGQDRVQGGSTMEADAENRLARPIKVRENPTRISLRLRVHH